MIINADDFGCVADGRWLREVSISAGSSVMTVPAGVVSALDVGTSVSIPGAADMQATIQGLPDLKRVEGAAITAGKKLLTFTVPESGRFVARHQGWLIVVDGAGPDGLSLLTVINEVRDVVEGSQVLVLADPAFTTAPSTSAQANDGIRARLRDHARASVGPLHLTIAGRPVDDATMTVGSKILRSAQARFSAQDLGESVTIEGAGHQQTTVQDVADEATVVLADPAQRTVVGGPADLWRPGSSCTQRFREMAQAAMQPGPDPAVIEFGEGVYDFAAEPMPDAPQGPLVAIGLRSLDGLTLQGSGRGVTVLRLMPEQGLRGTGSAVKDTHVLMAQDCRALRISGLTVNGAYLTMAEGGVEQMHGVVVGEGCKDVVLEDVEVFQSAGDGLRLLGAVGNRVEGVRADRCHLIQNHRSGVAIQREVRRVRIRACSIVMTAPGEDACIDLEPTGLIPAEAPSDVVIAFNTLIHGNLAVAVSHSGISRTRPARRVRFVRNTLTGGRVGGGHTEGLRFVGNTIDAGSAQVTGSMIRFYGRCVDASLEGNRILAAGQPADGISLSIIDAQHVRTVENDIRIAGIGINVTAEGNNVEVSRNHVHGDGGRPGIRVVTEGDEFRHGINVADNVVLDFGDTGIIVGPRGSMGGLQVPTITANTIDRQGEIPANLVGIELIGRPHQWQAPIVEDNDIGEAIPIKIREPQEP